MSGAEVAQAILNYGFETLQLSRLVCLIAPENIASVKVAEKIGVVPFPKGRRKIAVIAQALTVRLLKTAYYSLSFT